MIEDRLTLIFSTIRRNACALRLIESVRAVYPNLPILVADQWDEGTELESYCASRGVRYFRTEYDIGVSAARNFLISQLRTDYFLLADDDHCLNAAANIEVCIRFLDAHRDFAFVGGHLIEFAPEYVGENPKARARVRRYPTTRNMAIDETGRGLIVLPVEAMGGEVLDFEGSQFNVCDLPPIWGVGRRSAFGNDGLKWDPQLKIGPDHFDFYLYARFNHPDLRFACSDCIMGEHRPLVNPHYGGLRRRDYYKMFGEKWNLNYLLMVGGNIRKFSKFNETIPMPNYFVAESLEGAGDCVAQLQAARRANKILRQKLEELRPKPDLGRELINGRGIPESQ